MIALLNLSVLGFLLVFHDKAKRRQQGNLLGYRQLTAFNESPLPFVKIKTEVVSFRPVSNNVPLHFVQILIKQSEDGI